MFDYALARNYAKAGIGLGGVILKQSLYPGGLLVRLLDGAGVVLDFGCGEGLLTNLLARRLPRTRFIGIDLDADKIRVAQATARFNPGVVFERRDILEWPEYSVCDCVLLCDVLHYFPRELKAEVLRKVFQALRPGGCLIVRGRCALARTKPVTVCILKTKKPTSYCCARRVLTGLKSERTPGLARTRC